MSIHEFFKPETQTVRDIFSGYKYYQIPDYQRPYSWDDEIEQLWDDINSAFEDKDEVYFLGPVILAQTPKRFYEVVDGQQRLTTLTILFCVLRDLYLKKLDDNDPLKRAISDAVKSMVESKYRLRLITQAHYQNQFEQEILNEVKFPRKTLTKKEKQKLEYKFLNAALIFREKLKEIGDINKIKDFVNYLLDKVVMITITCSNTASAIRLFQIINTRGLELTTADLIKSSLYSKLKENERKQFILTWADIENIAEQNDETVTGLLTYYGYYLLAQKPKKSLYEELEIQFKHRKANEVVYEFKKFAKDYDEILNKPSKVIYSLRYLPDKVFWKTILTTAIEENFNEFEKLCKELRKLYYSYWIAGYTTAKTRNLSFNLIKLIKQKKAFNEILKELDRKMKDDKVLDSVMRNLQDDVYGNSWLKPLLILIEYGQTDESVFIEYSRDLHIDHILPEKWHKIGYWKKKWAKEKANYWLNKIGNLTLLSGRKNRKASNDEFPKKKRIYDGTGLDGRTGFEISKRIINKREWTEKEVTERQKWLIDEAKRVLGINF